MKSVLDIKGCTIEIKVGLSEVPSHCGLWGNEIRDLLAKRNTDILQISSRDRSLHSATLEINRIYKKCFRSAASGAI